jgi:prepilin peptidase CpaA
MLQLLQIATLMTAPVLMVFAASYDLLTMTIPNRLSLLMLAMFVLCALLASFGWMETGLHLSAGALVLAVGIGMFAAGWVGGGDVKFAAATAVWLGYAQLVEYLFVSALAGGVLTLAILALRRLPLPATMQSWTWLDRLHNPTNGVPYGIALAFGGLMVIPRSPLWLMVFGG